MEGSLRKVEEKDLVRQTGSVCRAVIRETASVSPDEADAKVYQNGHRIYQSLYPALRAVFGEIAAL